MIIFGTRGVELKGKPGDFFCPECNQDRVYRRITVRRFFTLYFIPLIPLDLLHEAAQCQTCRNSYRMSVLQYDPRAEREAQRIELRNTFRTILTQFAGMSTRRDSAFLQTIADLYTEFDGGTLTTEEIAEDLKVSRKDLELETSRIRPHLSDPGRETVVRCAYRAAAADGDMTQAKEDALAALAQGLGMTQAHYRGVVSDIQLEPEPG